MLRTLVALAIHEEKFLKYIDQLDRCIEGEARAGKVSQVRDLFYWFAYDAMGDFVSSRSFGMLQGQRWHWVITRFQRALSLLGPTSPVPWLVQLIMQLGPRISVLKDWFGYGRLLSEPHQGADHGTSAFSSALNGQILIPVLRRVPRALLNPLLT